MSHFLGGLYSFCFATNRYGFEFIIIFVSCSFQYASDRCFLSSFSNTVFGCYGTLSVPAPARRIHMYVERNKNSANGECGGMAWRFSIYKKLFQIKYEWKRILFPFFPLRDEKSRKSKYSRWRLKQQNLCNLTAKTNRPCYCCLYK
jgi:hypothetical protein